MKFLGIDLCSDSVKAVLIESSLNRYTVHDCYEERIQLEEPPSESLRRLLRQVGPAPHQTIMSVPNAVTTLRNVEFPSRSKKAIQSGLSFELEDEIPFPLESVYYDYSILKQTGKTSFIHVAIAPRESLTQFLQTFQEADLDPPYYTTQAWAYDCLFRRFLSVEQQESPRLLLKIGRKQTTLFLRGKKQPLYLWDIPWGGEHFTEALKKQGSSHEEATALKKKQGFLLLQEADLEKKKQGQALEKAARPLLQELKQAHLIARNALQEASLNLYLSGATTLVPGFMEWLGQKTLLPVEALHPFFRLAPHAERKQPEQEARFSLATALAIAAVGQDKHRMINFRKHLPLKMKAPTQTHWKVFLKPVLSVSIVLFSFILSTVVQKSIYTRQLETAQTQLEKNLKNFFGSLSKTALKTYLGNKKLLTDSIQKELTDYQNRVLLFGKNPATPLAILNQLSKKIPKDWVLDLEECSIGDNTQTPFSLKTKREYPITLRFLLTQQEQGKRLETLLKPLIKDLKVTQPTPLDTKWQVTLSGLTRDEAYDF